MVECNNAFIHMNISSLDTSKVVKYAIGVLPNQENVVLRKLIFKIIYFLSSFRDADTWDRYSSVDVVEKPNCSRIKKNLFSKLKLSLLSFICIRNSMIPHIKITQFKSEIGFTEYQSILPRTILTMAFAFRTWSATRSWWAFSRRVTRPTSKWSKFTILIIRLETWTFLALSLCIIRRRKKMILQLYKDFLLWGKNNFNGFLFFQINLINNMKIKQSR